MAAFADFLVERTRAMYQEWESHLEALRASGELTGMRPSKRTDMTDRNEMTDFFVLTGD